MKEFRNNRTISIRTLASGSAGNSILISSTNARILIDAGLSGRELLRRLACTGLTPKDISAAVITHEHHDHIRGIGVLSRQHKIPVYLNAMTLEVAMLTVGEIPTAHTFSTGDVLTVNDLTLQTYPVLHDAVDPIGLIVDNSSRRIGIALDMGHPTTLVKERLRGSHALILEFNHDPDMLRQCRRPWELKQRILSKTGHMSNEAAVGFLSELIDDQLQSVILAHISREANTEELASSCVLSHLERIGRSDIRIHIAHQDKVGDAIAV